MILYQLCCLLVAHAKYEIILDRFYLQTISSKEFSFALPAEEFELQIYLTVALNSPILQFHKDKKLITDYRSILLNQTTQLLSITNKPFPIELEQHFKKYYHRDNQLKISVKNSMDTVEYNLKIALITEGEDSCFNSCAGYGVCKQPLNICYCSYGHIEADCSVESPVLSQNEEIKKQLQPFEKSFFQYGFNTEGVKIFVDTDKPIYFDYQCLYTLDKSLTFNNVTEENLIQIGLEQQILEVDDFINEACQKKSDFVQSHVLFTVNSYLILGFYNPHNESANIVIKFGGHSQSGGIELIYIILIILTLTILFIIILCMIYWKYKEKKQQEELRTQSEVPIRKSVRTTTVQYQKVVLVYPAYKEITECQVCLQDFILTDHVTMTVCYHLFHKACLQEWKKMQNNCPQCRRELDQEGKDVEADNIYIQRIKSSQFGSKKTQKK